MNYFELFHIPVDLDIDLTQLKQKFLALQQQYHPDKASNKEQALIQSSEINHAYKTLSSIDSRAAYLLALHHQDQELEQSIHDLDFLDAALEIREQLDDASSQEQLSLLKKQLQKDITTLSQTFKSDYAQQNWHDAQDTVRKLKFYQRVINDIDKAEDRLFDDHFDLDDDF